jgi:two-component system, sensor histidine kinase and response regulator
VSDEASQGKEDRLRAEVAALRELLTGHERAARDSAGRLELAEAELRECREEVARLERDLREAEERTRVLVDASHDAVVTMDAQGRVTGWNAQAEVLFGWSALEVLGRRLSSFLIPPQHR